MYFFLYSLLKIAGDGSFTENSDGEKMQMTEEEKREQVKRSAWFSKTR